jgi:hypothetical protein
MQGRHFPKEERVVTTDDLRAVVPLSHLGVWVAKVVDLSFNYEHQVL